MTSLPVPSERALSRPVPRRALAISTLSLVINAAGFLALWVAHGSRAFSGLAIAPALTVPFAVVVGLAGVINALVERRTRAFACFALALAVLVALAWVALVAIFIWSFAHWKGDI